jgi:hypothetical protein
MLPLQLVFGDDIARVCIIGVSHDEHLIRPRFEFALPVRRTTQRCDDQEWTTQTLREEGAQEGDSLHGLTQTLPTETRATTSSTQ